MCPVDDVINDPTGVLLLLVKSEENLNTSSEVFPPQVSREVT